MSRLVSGSARVKQPGCRTIVPVASSSPLCGPRVCPSAHERGGPISHRRCGLPSGWWSLPVQFSASMVWSLAGGGQRAGEEAQGLGGGCPCRRRGFQMKLGIRNVGGGM